MNIQISILSVFVYVLLLKTYDGKLTYNYFDEMAQSFCAGHNYGVVMALRRNCPSRRSCNAICAAKKIDILYTHRIKKYRVSCYAVYKIRKNFKKLQDNPRRSQPDAERVIFQSSGYGKGGCAQIEKGRRCGPGPNYCCCNAF